MPIVVVCTSCRSRFQVGDQYAGKSGPCPKCKAVIKIPGKNEQVAIHGAEEFASGGRNATGQLVLKPIARKETKFSWLWAVGIAAAGIAVVAATAMGAQWIKDSRLLQLLVLLIVSGPIAIAPYTFLRNDELDPYSGPELYVRTAICAASYIVLWVAFEYVAGRVLVGGAEIWTWFYFAPPFFLVGSLVALACYDLDFASGLMHYSFYVLVTILLRWLGGMGWVWQFGMQAPA